MFFPIEFSFDNFYLSLYGRTKIKLDTSKVSFSKICSQSQYINYLLVYSSIIKFWLHLFMLRIDLWKEILIKSIIDIASKVFKPWFIMKDVNYIESTSEKSCGEPFLP